MIHFSSTQTKNMLVLKSTYRFTLCTAYGIDVEKEKPRLIPILENQLTLERIQKVPLNSSR
ncbi:hypothetical protein SAMN05660420_00097 [Desulfuromusa kysingii]|uniref:Uncharacterized protein n=1 Tax=Desulfuromusa kysingii TaxID=37625 RepID=A0A1H3VIW6_9BACT|nr:hypothetical protein SAMN05660420_00097 [Desulfuromusa kysingii]